jgi:hypothetical protein
MPTLISSVMEAPSNTDQLFTRSKHTPQKVVDVGNRPEILTPLVARPAQHQHIHVNNTMGMDPATLPRGAA